MTGSTDFEDELMVHLPALRAFAMSLIHNVASADELVHETIARAWTNQDKFAAGSNMRAWLFTILRNAFYSEMRRKKREVLDQQDYFAQSQAEKPAHDGRLQLADFRTAFSTLPVEQREALVLVGASGFSYGEAAKMCDVAVGTIKSRVNRGRARLAELLHLDEDGASDLTDPAVFAVVNAARNKAF